MVGRHLTRRLGIAKRYGGKRSALRWLLPQFPTDDDLRLVDVFGGSGVVVANRPPGWRGWYNDLESDIVSWLRMIVEDPENAQRLAKRWQDTDESFAEALQSECPSAWVFRTACSWGAMGKGRNDIRSNRKCEDRWGNYVASIPYRAMSFERVRITCRDFRDVIPECGAQDMLYLDPPYLHGTRGNGPNAAEYLHEMTDADHSAMLELALAHPGPVMISGYPSDLYDDALAEWHRLSRRGWTPKNINKTEVTWRNYREPDLWLQP